MRILCIDCEGPLTLNDNAFEICRSFLPGGEVFFKTVSSFDDLLADVIKKEGYSAGSTLRLIVPFFKAFGLSNQKIEEFSLKTLRFVPGADRVIKNLKHKMEIFIISTSYTPYIKALCEKISFPFQNAFSTFLDLDSYSMEEKEKEKLLLFYQKIKKINLSPPKGKKSLSSEEEKALFELEEIFFKEIPSMKCAKIMEKVNPVGGEEKEKAILACLNKTCSEPQDVIYVGDSITDTKALRFVREKEGASISFNGNIYALREAEFACISLHSFPLFLIIKKFKEGGRNLLLKLSSEWPEMLEKEERKKLKQLAPESIFVKVEKENFPFIVEESEKTRKKLRGKIIGALG